VAAVNQNNKLSDVHISGDFFFFPSANLVDLEQALDGVSDETEAITRAVAAFYQKYNVESPGVVPADFANVLTV
jgi:hypothetical protein